MPKQASTIIENTAMYMIGAAGAINDKKDVDKNISFSFIS